MPCRTRVLRCATAIVQCRGTALVEPEYGRSGFARRQTVRIGGPAGAGGEGRCFCDYVASRREGWASVTPPESSFLSRKPGGAAPCHYRELCEHAEDQVAATVHSESAIDAIQMRVNRVNRYAEPLRDGTFIGAVKYASDYVEFSSGDAELQSHRPPLLR